MMLTILKSNWVTTFSEFYIKLVGKRSTHPDVETAVKNLFSATLVHLKSSDKLRKDRLAVRPLQAQLNAAYEKLEASREKLSQSKEALKKAKQELRNARARERRRQKKAKSK